MMWQRTVILFIMFLLGKHICFPSSPRYLELADSADFFIARENWPRAEEKIVQALRLEPANFTNSLLLANLGMIQVNQGKYAQAQETLSMGLNLAPNSTVLLNNRAHAYLLSDSISKATLDLDKSLSIDSIQEWPLTTRAFLYLHKGDIENSNKLFNIALNNFAENASVYSGLAAISETKGEISEAQKYYKKAIELQPDDNEARVAYVFLLIKSNDFTSARLLLKEGISLDPEYAMFYLLRGYLHRLNYRPEEALADKKLAISKGIDPIYASDFIP